MPARAQSSSVPTKADENRDRLREDIGERIAKTLVRAGPSHEGQRHITESILEKINRKSATGSGVIRRGIRRDHLRKAELTLTPEERAILDAPHEIVVVYGPDARLLKAVTDYETEFSSVPSDLSEGSWFSHQHPGGRGPSSWDLDYLARNRHLICRIVASIDSGKVEIFEITVSDGADPLVLDAAVVFYQDAANLLGDTADARREALELLATEFPATFVVKSRTL